MGIIEGSKKNIISMKVTVEMCSVIPLGNDLYNLGNYGGIHTRKVFKGNVTKVELDKLKRNINYTEKKN